MKIKCYLSARSCSIRDDDDEEEEDEEEIDAVDFFDDDDGLFPSSRLRFKSSTYFDM